jgi:hypothetical protein
MMKIQTGIAEIDTIENFGAYQYKLTVAQDSDGIPNFVVGEYVQQLIDSAGDVYMKGNVIGWNDSDKVLSLAHVGATDGLYHEFLTTRPINALTSGAYGNVTLVANEQNIDVSDQSDDFSTEISGFIDFSETNPFGDIT